jgi:acetyl-CoA acyltransferase
MSDNSRTAVIVATARTPFGKHGGALATLRPDDLAATVMQAVVARAAIEASMIDDVFFGCANQAGEDNRNVARMAALLAGFPVTVPAVTVNRLCGSGLEAINQAAKAILCGEGEVFLAGGVESMSRAPYVMPKPERGYATGHSQLFDTTLGWRFINPRLQARYGSESMGETAENLADLYQLSRLEQDEFALHSQQKAQRALKNHCFASEIVPVEVMIKQKSQTITDDEGIRGESTLAALSGLKAVFRQGGSVTAGNASPLNDGATALLLTSEGFAEAHKLPVLARIRAFATTGVAPRIMGIGPVAASHKVLGRLGHGLNDLAHLELNEAFAAQSIAVLRELGLDWRDARLNPWGGAIALGHPLGASGGRLIITMIEQLRRGAGGLGLAAMCIGVGQGIATLIEV